MNLNKPSSRIRIRVIRSDNRKPCIAVSHIKAATRCEIEPDLRETKTPFFLQDFTLEHSLHNTHLVAGEIAGIF